MDKNNVLRFEFFQKKRQINIRVLEYRQVIDKMEKVERLEEFTRLYEKFKNKTEDFIKSEESILRGLVISRAVQRECETTELFMLTGTIIDSLNTKLNQLKGNIA